MDYRQMYRQAFDYHARWIEHPPETPEDLTRCVKDLQTVQGAGNYAPFLVGLLAAVYEEICRQYKATHGANSEGMEA